MKTLLQRAVAGWHLVRAFTAERWGPHPCDRQALLALQQRRLRRFLRYSLAGVPFYARRPRKALVDLPIVDKPSMLTAFEQFNRHGVTLQQALAAARRAESGADSGLPNGLTAGLSSGTSGARGVFLVSPRERGTWAGTLLAQVLSAASLRQLLTPWAPRLTVAFFLRANSGLYTTLNSWRLRLAWLPLTLPGAEQLQRLQTLAPQILVAPASVLGTLARAQLDGRLAITPRQIISVAEVLEDDDADTVRRAWGCMPEQIYQCTEGLLGSSCEQGHVHLNEEHLLIEPEWLDTGHSRMRPLVTDFTRGSQAFVRFRLDDVLRPLPAPCACGRATLALLRIEGRGDDLLWLADACGTPQPLYPDALRHAIAQAQQDWPASAVLQDYRLEQHADHWLLRTQPTLPTAQIESLREALSVLCRAVGLPPPGIELAPWVEDASQVKRRRIRCMTQPSATPMKDTSCAS